MVTRKWYRTRPNTWVSTGGTFNIDTSVLTSALSKFVAPVISKIEIRFNMVVSTGTTGGRTHLLASLLDKILLNDGAGERINLSGNSHRAVTQMELGRAGTGSRAVAASATGVALEHYFPLVFSPKKAFERADFNIPLVEFLAGGKLDLTLRSGSTLGAAQEFTALTSGTFEVAFLIEEDKVPERKMRMCVKDYNLLKTEDTVPVGASLRFALLYGGITAELAGTYWPVGTYSSTTLELENQQGSLLAQDYQEESNALRGVDVVVVAAGDDMVLTDYVAQAEYTMSPRYVVPLYIPKFDQKYVDFPPIDSLHYKIDGGAFPGGNTDGKVIICSITGNDPNLTALTLKVKPGSLIPALKQAGTISGGRRLTDESIPDHTRKIAPTRIRKPKN